MAGSIPTTALHATYVDFYPDKANDLYNNYYKDILVPFGIKPAGRNSATQLVELLHQIISATAAHILVSIVFLLKYPENN